ncbi:hypothetical protein NMD70_08245 [Edwardsiella tarda]|uniref:hypothetical protein n=1 Tax=Edwardsiella tarda TaxID=636 RepID=UPI00351CA9B2
MGDFMMEITNRYYLKEIENKTFGDIHVQHIYHLGTSVALIKISSTPIFHKPSSGKNRLAGHHTPLPTQVSYRASAKYATLTPAVMHLTLC